MMLTIIIDWGLCFPLVFSLSVSYWDEGWGIKWSAVHLRRNLLMTPQYINSGSQIGHVHTFYIHLLDDEEHLQDSSAQIILHYHPWSLELFGIRAFILMNIFEYLLHVVGLLSNFVRHLLDSSGLSRPPLHSTWFLCAVRWLCLVGWAGPHVLYPSPPWWGTPWGLFWSLCRWGWSMMSSRVNVAFTS